MKFNTQDWADEYKKCLNNNPNYAKSAKTWEGPLVLVFISENNRISSDVMLWLDIFHGKCREAKFIANLEENSYEYIIEATETTWSDLITEKMKASRALMSGKFKIKGNVSKLMRYPKAAGYIIKYLKRLLINWK